MGNQERSLVEPKKPRLCLARFVQIGCLARRQAGIHVFCHRSLITHGLSVLMCGVSLPPGQVLRHTPSSLDLFFFQVSLSMSLDMAHSFGCRYVVELSDLCSICRAHRKSVLCPRCFFLRRPKTLRWVVHLVLVCLELCPETLLAEIRFRVH